MRYILAILFPICTLAQYRITPNPGDPIPAFGATGPTGPAGPVSSVGINFSTWTWITAGAPVTTSGNITLSPTAAQTSHQVIGTCGTATTFLPCNLLIGDLPAAVVTSITNDTNVTGSIASQVLTLGWTGTLAKSRMLSTVVFTDQANTYSTGLQDFSNTAVDLRIPNHSADPGTCSVGQLEFNTTGATFKGCTATNTWGAIGGGGGLADPGANGPIKRTSLNVTAPALAADIVGLFSTCSGTLYLGADGACHSASGSATQPQVHSLGTITGSNTLTATSNVEDAWMATINGTTTFTAASFSAGEDIKLILTTGSSWVPGTSTLTLPTGFSSAFNMTYAPVGHTVNMVFHWNGTTADYISTADITQGICPETTAPSGNATAGSEFPWCDSTTHVPSSKDASGNTVSEVRPDTTTLTGSAGMLSANTGVMMTRANAQNNPDKYLLDAGSSGTTYTVCPNVNTPVAGLAITGYQDGMDFTFVPHTSSSGTVTINVCAQGPVPAYMLSGSSLVAVTGTAPTNLIAGVDYKIVYNSVTPSFEVTPMNSAGGSGTVTTTGSPASPQLASFSGPTSITTATSDTVSGAFQCADVSGSGTAQSCNTAPTFTPSKGDMIIYTTTTANTGALTVAVNGATAAGVYKWGGSTAVVSGDITANKPFKLIFDAAGHWDTDDIGNAPSGGGITCTTCTNTQVAFATGASTITTDAGLTYTHPATNKNLLTITNGSADTQGDAVLAFNANGGGTLLSMMNIGGFGALNFGGSFISTVPTIYSSGSSLLGIQGGLGTPIQLFMQGTQIWTDVNPTNKFEVNAQGSTQSGVPARAIQASSDMIYQYSSTTASGGTADTGWARHGAGVLEINNGTAGGNGGLFIAGLTSSNTGGNVCWNAGSFEQSAAVCNSFTPSNVTGQSTSQSAVTLATAPTAGSYRINYYADQNATCTTGSNSVAFTFNWTDGTNARTLTTGTLTLSTAQTTSEYISGLLPIQVGSGNVTYTSTVTGTCATGTSTYDVHASLERLQ